MIASTTSTRRIGRWLFIALLVVHVLSCYVMGTFSLFNWPFALETGFGIPHDSSLDILGVVVGLELIFLGSIAVLGIYWTRQGQSSGIVTGMAVGMYMFLFGIVSFLLLGRIDGLIVDSIRGFLTLIFGWMAYQELNGTA